MGKPLSLLKEFRALGLERHAHPDSSGIGSDADERFDALFKKIIAEAGALELAAEAKQARDRVKTEQLFFGVILIWTAIVGLAVMGLRNREARQTQWEKALREANDELERRVEERTMELSSSNLRLQQEIAERKQAEEGFRLYEAIVSNMPLGVFVGHRENLLGNEPPRLRPVNPVAAKSQECVARQLLGATEPGSPPTNFQAAVRQLCSEVARSGRAEILDESATTPGPITISRDLPSLSRRSISG